MRSLILKALELDLLSLCALLFNMSDLPLTVSFSAARTYCITSATCCIKLVLNIDPICGGDHACAADVACAAAAES